MELNHYSMLHWEISLDGFCGILSFGTRNVVIASGVYFHGTLMLNT